MNFIKRMVSRVLLTRQFRKSLMDRKQGDSPAELSRTVTPLFQVMLANGPKAVNLRGLDYGEVNSMHLAAVLGATYGVRDEVRGWNEALEVAKTALFLDQHDWQDALGGLYEDS